MSIKKRDPPHKRNFWVTEYFLLNNLHTTKSMISCSFISMCYLHSTYCCLKTCLLLFVSYSSSPSIDCKLQESRDLACLVHCSTPSTQNSDQIGSRHTTGAEQICALLNEYVNILAHQQFQLGLNRKTTGLAQQLICYTIKIIICYTIKHGYIIT